MFKGVSLYNVPAGKIYQLVKIVKYFFPPSWDSLHMSYFTYLLSGMCLIIYAEHYILM